MVESDGSVEVGNRNSKCGRDRTNRGIRQSPIAIVEGVKNTEQRRGLVSPIADDLRVSQKVAR